MNNIQNSALNKYSASKDFSLSKLQGFLEFEKSQKKIMRGEIEMYDVNGHYKYLTLGELFDWYMKM